MKARSNDEVKTYAETFAEWIEGYDRAHPLRALIDIDSQNMLPRADEIIAYARNDRSQTRGGALAESQTPHPHRHHRRRHRHGRARPRLQLADRPQHHAAAATALPP